MHVVLWMIIGAVVVVIVIVDVAYRLYHLRKEELSLREKLFYVKFNVVYVRFRQFKMPFWLWGVLVLTIIVFLPLIVLLMLGELGRISF